MVKDSNTHEIIRKYYYLTKPGIVYGNALAAIAGFFLASKGNFNPLLFFATIVGSCLVIASACVYNNYIDRDIDARMDRTKKRAFATGQVSKKNALIYASILIFLGFTLLLKYTNLLTAVLGAIGVLFYLGFYTIGKRQSVHGTLIGSVSGSIPLVAGYTAVTNQFDTGAIVLFLILAIWQMPHFYAIALFRMQDYKKAGLPVLPVARGVRETKIQMICYIVAFLLSATLLTFFHYTGYIYLLTMIGVSIYWLWLAVKGWKTTDITKWARKVFGFSLIVLITFCSLLVLSAILP